MDFLRRYLRAELLALLASASLAMCQTPLAAPSALIDTDIAAMVAFIHDQKTQAETRKGGRRGVETIDLQTGNADAGRQYFNGAGKCSSCHSPTGDLAGVAKRFEGLALEQRLLYPKNV